MNRAHPHPLAGGSPLLRAAKARRTGAFVALLLRTLFLLPFVVGVLALASLAGCATLNDGAEAFAPTFDERWMSLTIVDDRTVATFCQHAAASDGCAKTWRDTGAPDPSPTDTTAVPRGLRCSIFLNSRLLPETSRAYRAVLAHEVRHCRGWHHAGE